MTSFTTTTLGTWKHNDGRVLWAVYFDDSTIRVDRNDGSTDYYSNAQWEKLAKQLKSVGFVHS
jgi:hypothetical protein